MLETESESKTAVFSKNQFENARQLLISMRRIRLVEETIASRYSSGHMRCPVHLSTGQEAVAAAVGLALRKNDLAVSGHRAHAHYIGKGGCIRRMLAEIYGKKTGCCQGKGGSMHLIDTSVGFMGSTAIVGGTIPIGVGLALSLKLKKTDAVCCIFLGDGAIEEGAFYESANFAALKSLPVLFVCENNFYSVYSPLKVRQPAGRKIYEMTQAIGIDSHLGDGNSAYDVYELTLRALRKIRSGEGPQFLEFTTYRWREHCGPNFDNDIGYRQIEEYEEWRRREPIAPLETALLSHGLLNNSDLKRIDTTIEIEVQEAFKFAEDSQFPEPEEAYTHLFKSGYYNA